MILVNIKDLIKIFIKNKKLNLLSIDNNIYDIILVSKYLTKAYLSLYIISKTNNKILFVNTKVEFNNLLTKQVIVMLNPYIFAKWKHGILNNWKTFKKTIILYRWITNIINLKQRKKLTLSSKLYNKIGKIYIKLHSFCKGIYYLNELPKNIFLINYIPSIYSEILISKKTFICITSDKSILDSITIPIFSSTSEKTLSIILKFLSIAWLQAIYL